MHTLQRSGVSGFTLIELMVVIVILGMLATVVVVNVMEYVERARVTTTEVQIKEFMKALDFYRLDYGTYPSSGQGLKALTQTKKGGTDPYVKDIPEDRWGHPFRYRCSGSSYDIISYGADGREGGTGYSADIKSSTLGKK